MTPATFTPRASSLGAHLACTWRAAQDRLRIEGRLPQEILSLIEPDNNQYTALGTCIHFTMQDGIGGVFPSRDPESAEEFAGALQHFGGDNMACLKAFQTGNPKAYQPSVGDWQAAARNFGDNMDLTRINVRASAALGSRVMPRSPDGKPWLVEPTVSSEWVTGHMDFLSQCGTQGGDLKTTSRMPDKGKIKTEHLAQMCAYHILTEVKTLWVLYLDSQNAGWTSTVWLEFEEPDRLKCVSDFDYSDRLARWQALQGYVDQVWDFIQLLKSDKIFDLAYPNLGDHCEKTWCPYRNSCYRKIMPRPGRVYDAAKANRPVGVFKAASLFAPQAPMVPSAAPQPPTFGG